MKTMAQQLIQFYQKLTPPPVPKGFQVMHPQPDKVVMDILKKFFEKFYYDSYPNLLVDL